MDALLYHLDIFCSSYKQEIWRRRKVIDYYLLPGLTTIDDYMACDEKQGIYK